MFYLLLGCVVVCLTVLLVCYLFVVLAVLCIDCLFVCNACFGFSWWLLRCLLIVAVCFELWFSTFTNSVVYILAAFNGICFIMIILVWLFGLAACLVLLGKVLFVFIIVNDCVVVCYWLFVGVDGLVWVWWYCLAWGLLVWLLVCVIVLYELFVSLFRLVNLDCSCYL